MEVKKAVSRFKITSSSEEPFSFADNNQKLTSGKYVTEYSGDIEGTSVLMELKNYTSREYASIYGLERMNAILDGKRGSFVFEHIGIFTHGVVISKRTILPKSVTGELTGLRGEANFSSEDSDSFELTLDYYFEE
jgi:hypothetical protein